MTRNAKLRSFLAKWLIPPFASVALQPIARVRDRAGFERAMAADAVAAVQEAESRITRAYQGGPLFVASICGACEKFVDLRADMLFGGRRDREGRFVPNWRERLVRPDYHAPGSPDALDRHRHQVDPSPEILRVQHALQGLPSPPEPARATCSTALRMIWRHRLDTVRGSSGRAVLPNGGAVLYEHPSWRSMAISVNA